MSFQMYKNTSDNRYLNKSITALGSALPCSFKDNTTMENPVIFLSPGAYDPDCNYGYLSDTGRYYYVVDVTYSQQRIEVQLKVDVLKSFADEIKAAKCIALRSSNQYNSYLNDERYTQLAYDKPVLHKFDNSFSKNNQFILTIAGGV